MEEILEKEELSNENIQTNMSKLDTVGYYIWYFFIFSSIGWIYEVLFELSRGNGFINRGFNYGCYLPIYGFGVLFLYLVLNRIMKKKIEIGKISIMPIVIFFAIIILASLLEYVASWSLEMIFNQRWWDYTYEKYNLNGRIFLKNSLAFGIVGMITLYWLEPGLRKIYLIVKNNILNYVAIVIACIITIDMIVSTIGHII